MMGILMQIDPTGPANKLIEYGILGIFSVLLLAGLVYIFRMFIGQIEKRLEQTEKELSYERLERIKLQDRLDSYLAADSQKVQTLLQECTNAIKQNSDLIIKMSAKLGL